MWDPSEYGGIEEINLPAEQIWIPDIALYNSAEGSFSVSIMTKAKVRFDGHVIWNPPAIFRSFCEIDITYFPFDSQNCHLKFGSWTYGMELNLKHMNDTRGVIERGTDLSKYYQNVEWDIMQATAQWNNKTYSCCPNEFYIDVTFNFNLRRKPLFYTVNLILPCIGITFFSFLVFYLPSDSGEKVTLTISILVSLIFFLSVLIETIPSTSLAMPLLGKYIVFTLILITLSVCATVCVLNIHFRTPSTHSMPPWIKRWCMDILPKYLLMSVPQYQNQSTNILPEQLIYMHNQAYASQAVSVPAVSGAGGQASALQRQQLQRGPSGELAQQGAPPTSACHPQSRLDRQPSSSERSSSAASLAAARKQRHTAACQVAELLQAQRPLELEPGNLSNPASFLPYLQSEAARRLQLQRSRSSERDKSTSGDQSSAAADGNSFKDQNRLLDLTAGELERQTKLVARSEQTASGKRRALAQPPTQTQTRPQPRRWGFWNFLGSSSNKQSQRAPPGPRTPESVSLADNQMAPAGDKQRQLSISITTTNASQQNDPDDDYQHHRHFQARASICSNNLWRIGPTRRCSLAVPMVNYPSYYRPLAQLQQHSHAYRTSCSGGQPSTISGCLQQPQQQHYHVHGQDSAEESSSMSSSQRRSGTALGTLITAATSNLLVRPKEAHREATLEGREMEPITSGGFIANPPQLPRSANAVPPQRHFDLDDADVDDDDDDEDLDDSVARDGRGIAHAELPDAPAPPPPLPAGFGGQDPQAMSANMQRAQALRLAGEPDCSKNLAQTQSSLSSAALTMAPQTIRRNESAAHATASPSGPGRQLEQLRGGRALLRSSVQQQRQAHLASSFHQFSLPRSQSTDKRLSNQSQPISVAPNMSQALHYERHQQQQQQLLYQAGRSLQQPQFVQVPLMSGQHSIGRALGQAYIQRLHRQPNVYLPSRQPTSVEQSGGSKQLDYEAEQMLDAQIRLARQQKRQQPAASCNLAAQRSLMNAASMVPPSIDMLRRSRSQCSLGGRARQQQDCGFDTNYAPQQAQRLIDCELKPQQQHCSRRMDGMNAGSLQGRARSETRARVNSASGRGFQVDAALADQIPRANLSGAQQSACNCASVHANGHIIAANCELPRLQTQLQLQQQQQQGRCFGAGRNNENNFGCPVSRKQLNNHNKNAHCDDQVQIQLHQKQQQVSTLSLLKLVSEVDKAIQNAMFIAQHIDNLDEFESVKENWKYIAMVIDRIFLLIFLFACIFGTLAIFSLVPWHHYLTEKPIDLQMIQSLALNLTSSNNPSRGCSDY